MDNTLTNLNRSRKYVWQLYNGFNFSEVLIKNIFEEYDSLFFYNELTQKIRYAINPKLKDGIEYHEGIVYFNPIVITEIAKRLNIDTLNTLLLLVEHELIHLAMELWLKSHPPKVFDKEIYGYHGKLYRCVLYKCFKHPPSLQSHNLGGGSPSETMTPEPKGYAYYQNSCYMDSLLVLLYHTTPFKTLLLHTPLVKPTKIAKDLRHVLLNDYGTLTVPTSGKGPITCINIRLLLSQLLPDTKTKLGGWKTYNVARIWALMTDIFPELKFSYTYNVISHGKAGPETEVREALLTFWDFMDPLDDVGDVYKRINWRSIDAPFLVFYNGGTPRITKLWASSPKKARVFGEYILDGKYRLVGVITLLGVRSGVSPDMGSHYVSYFWNRGWYGYDDLKNKIVKLDALPRSGVMEESEGKMPSMYFYTKV